MPKYVIERQIPGIGSVKPEVLQKIAQKSNAVLDGLPEVQWVQSYVTANAIHCVYIAPNAELVREHAKRGDFPANQVMEVAAIIDPTTAETAPAMATH